MKIIIEDYLHKIDTALKNKPKKDVQLTYVMVAAVIFAFAYLLFWDSSENDFLDQNTQISAIQSKINIDRAYLAANPPIKLATLEGQIKEAQSKMLDYKDKNDYIKSKISEISSLIYDERTWGIYINSISLDAQKYNIKISEFTNAYSQNNGSFGHILDLSIEFSGSYKNTLRFINALEKNDLVVDIHTLSIKAQGKLITKLKISVWGITY